VSCLQRRLPDGTSREEHVKLQLAAFEEGMPAPNGAKKHPFYYKWDEAHEIKRQRLRKEAGAALSFGGPGSYTITEDWYVNMCE
jgi:hypothetical protein